jgi:hypothetical protein
MASTDALPIPRKNVAFRVTFPILDNDGDLVTGAAGLDSEVSKDGGTFTDCTNEATEIATSSGMYYLDLTSTEMNADTVAIIVKTSTTDAKTTTIVIYPAEDAELRASVRDFGGTNGTFSGGRPEVNTTHVGGSTIQQMGGRVDANAYTVASGAITSSSFAASAIDSSSLAGSAISAIQSGLATASDLSTLYGYVTTTLGSPSDLGSGASIAANLVDIESQTDDIGVAGAGLTATGLATATIDTIRDSVVAIFTDDVGTAQAGAAGTITLRSGAVAIDDYYNGAYVTITGGTGVGQTRKITAYAGSTTKVATVDSNWVTNPDNTSTYIILGRAV